LLGEVETETADSIVLADMEAGLGTLSRMIEGHVDYILVVTGPYWKALEVAQRAVSMAQERQVGQVFVLANRIQNEAQLEMVRQALPGQEILVIPEDDAIRRADLKGVAPIDANPDSPAMQALSAVVSRLTTFSAEAA
jgi:CO dehydrogenase maturation factor